MILQYDETNSPLNNTEAGQLNKMLVPLFELESVTERFQASQKAQEYLMGLVALPDHTGDVDDYLEEALKHATRNQFIYGMIGSLRCDQISMERELQAELLQ